MRVKELMNIARGKKIRRSVLFFVEMVNGQPTVTRANSIHSNHDIGVMRYPVVKFDRQALQPQIDKLLQR